MKKRVYDPRKKKIIEVEDNSICENDDKYRDRDDNDDERYNNYEYSTSSNISDFISSISIFKVTFVLINLAIVFLIGSTIVEEVGKTDFATGNVTIASPFFENTAAADMILLFTVLFFAAIIFYVSMKSLTGVGIV